MKKIFIFDGSPRKQMNTAQMIEAFTKGAQAAAEDVEVKHIRLYDIDFKGCYSCMACKVKGNKFHEYCGYKDGITEILKEAAYADGIVFASPVYFGDMTAMTRAVFERLTFPWLSYDDYSTHAPKRVPTAFIYTMNATAEHQAAMMDMYERNENLIGIFLQKPERVLAINTCQVKDYSRYELGAFSVEEKHRWRDEHFELDLQNAFGAGQRMVEKILAAK